MRDSDIYLAILDEGRAEEAKAGILRLGAKRLGQAAAPVMDQLKGITDLDRLPRIQDRLLDATSWQDLLDTP